MRQLLQNETENSYQIFIIKFDRGLLQGASGITKCNRLLLQTASGITCDRLLLQSLSGITKCGSCYKVRCKTGEEILPLQQHKIIEETKFTYSLLGKAFKKQTKTIEKQGEKQIKSLQSLNPHNQKTQIYQAQIKSVNHLFRSGQLHQKAIDELPKLIKI